MQDGDGITTSSDRSAVGVTAAAPAKRQLRSLVLAWRDEESGDELTIDVSGSERFLDGLAPLGFRRVARSEAPAASVHGSNTGHEPRGPHGRGRPPASKGSPDRSDTEAAEHRVRWTVRLARYWKPKRS